MFRVGLGQDSHRFSADPGRALVLAGVRIAGAPGLDGNSDADVVLHALCRALEQALGEDAFSRYADADERKTASTTAANTSRWRAPASSRRATASTTSDSRSRRARRRSSPIASR